MAKKKKTPPVAYVVKKPGMRPASVLLLMFLTFVVSVIGATELRNSIYEGMLHDEQAIAHKQAGVMNDMEKNIVQQDKDLGVCTGLLAHKNEEPAPQTVTIGTDKIAPPDDHLQKQVDTLQTENANLKSQRDRLTKAMKKLQCAYDDASTGTKHGCD